MLLSARLRRGALTALGTAVLLAGCTDAQATQEPGPDRTTPAPTGQTTPARTTAPTTPDSAPASSPVVPPVVGGRPIE